MDISTGPTPKMKIETIFLIFSVFFGVLTAIIQPVFSAPDEYVHFKHAYSIFYKNTDEVFNEIDSQIALLPNQPTQKEETAARESGLAAPIPESSLQRSYQNGQVLNKVFIETISNKKEMTLKLSFKDIKWLPQALGIMVGEIIHPSIGIIVLFGRLFNLSVYITAIYFSIKKAKLGGRIMAAVALLPMSIQQASSLSYDVLYYVAIFVSFSLITNLWKRETKLDLKWLLYLLLTCVLLFIPKHSVLTLGLFFITLPTALFGDNIFTKKIDMFWKLCSKYKNCTFIVGILLFLMYMVYEFRFYGGAFRGLQVLFNTFFRPDLYTNLDDVLVSGIIGNFGQMTYRFPAWLVVLNFIFLFILLLSEPEEKINTRVAVSGVLIYLSVLIMTAVIMFQSWTKNTLNLPNALVSLGNQGRYYTPFLIVLVPLGIKMRNYLSINAKETTIRAMFNYLVIFNLTYFLVLTILYYYTSDLGANFLPNISHWFRGLF